MRRENMNRDENMSTAKLGFLNKRLVCLIATLGLAVPLVAQDAEKVAEDAIGKKIETVDPEKVKNIEIILKQQYELEGDTYVMEANELIKHKRYEAASDKFDAAKNRYEKVSKSEPSILKKIAEVDRLHSQTLRMLADKLVKEAIKNADEKSSTAFDKAIGKLTQAKLLDPSRTEEIDNEIKIVNKKIKLFDHEQNVGKEKLRKKFKFDPDEGSIANGIHFSRAKILYADRRFMEAKGLVERILMNQPYNEEAVNLLFRINKKILAAGKERHRMIRQEFIDEVLWKWSDPIVAYSKEDVIKAETETVDDDSTLGGIYKKLQIVIPKVFQDLTLILGVT